MAKPTARKSKTNTGQANNSDLLKQQEKLWEDRRSENRRIAECIRLNNDLHWPPDGLTTKIESDNGRLRLWLEIKNDTSAKSVLRTFSQLCSWKERLVMFDKKRDPLPHPLPEILKQLHDDGQTFTQVSTQINAWIAKRMFEWEKADSNRRRWIDSEVAGVLRHFGFSHKQSDQIMNDATTKIRSGRYPFLKMEKPKGDEGVVLPRDGYPITRDLLKSRERTWRKKQ